MLISIIGKSFEKDSRQNLSFYSFIFLTLIISKAALEPTNSDPQSLTKFFTKYVFWLEVLNQCDRLHNLYYHYQDCFIAISVLKYKNDFKFYQMHYYPVT